MMDLPECVLKRESNFFAKLMPKSISDRIALLFLGATLIPVVLFGIFIAYGRHNYLQENLLAQQQAEVRNLGNFVSDYFDKLTVEVEFVSSLFARQGMKDSEKFVLLKTLQAFHPDFLELGTLDRNGRKFIAQQGVDKPPSYPLLQDDEILKQILSHRQFVASITGGAEGENSQLKLTCPVFFLDKQFINGAILATVNLDELNRQLARYSSAAGIEAALLLSSGEKISEVPLTLPDGFTIAEFKGRFPHGGSEIAGDRALAFIPIQYHNLDFILLISSDLSQVQSLHYRSLFNYIALFLLILVTMLLTGHFFVRRLFSTPLKTLTKAAERIRDGDLSQNVKLDGENEFSELAGTFNSMTSALGTSHAKNPGRIPAT